MRSKKLKKWYSVLLTSVMVVGLLTGCSFSGKDSDKRADGGEVVIDFGIHVANPKEQEKVTYNIVQAFNEKNKGKYKVEFQAADTESHSKNMKLAASDNTLPEIFWLDASEAPEYDEAGVLLDLSGFLAQNSDVKNALGSMKSAFTDDNGQFGLPYQCNVQGIFYNKELFDKAGVAYPTNETTYEDMLSMIAKFKENGIIPLSIGSKNSGFAMWEFNETLARYGWEENIESILAGDKKFNNKDLVACFEKLKGLADAGAFPENMATIEYFDAKQLFNIGQAAMFGTGQWDCAEFDKNIGNKIGFWWGPIFTDTAYEQKIAMKVPSAPIVVNAKVAEDKAVQEAVFEFLKFYYSKEAAELSYEGSIFPATNYEGMGAADTQYAMNAMLNALASGWKSPSTAPDLTVTSAVQEALYNSLFGVMQKTYTPEEALDLMDDVLKNTK
ncbi:extracellular solute-binding protein [Clostridiales bacterium COT073_COT-073]|nr:extracellular solute-binding protein [Clostridiales bacterium COT073_COT-073]